MSEQPVKTFITTLEFSKMIRASKAKIFRFVKEVPDFPKAYRVGVCFIFDRDEVMAWIDNQRIA